MTGWKRNRALAAVSGAVILVGLPLGGILFAGKPVAPYLEFPPRTVFVAHAPFSAVVFAGLGLAIVAICLPFVVRLARPLEDGTVTTARLPFPWWGWLGVAVTLVSWVLAWNRFPWFAPLQPFTFAPLWAGYILTVNGLTAARTGRSVMTDRPAFYIALFPMSAIFWWYFEYLNRFVQNWHYLGIGDLGPWGYFLNATVSFSTVLPAVVGTADLLRSFRGRLRTVHGFLPIRLRNPGPWAWSVLACAAAGLVGIGIWPDYLFPLLWTAPLLVIASIQAILGEETVFSPIARGDWRPVVTPALAALICGFFWEMWNVMSLAHWEYSLPFVGRFEIFEMPLLGYAGYLPFGLECAVVAGLLQKSAPTDGGSRIDANSSPPPAVPGRAHDALRTGISPSSVCRGSVSLRPAVLFPGTASPR